MLLDIPARPYTNPISGNNKKAVFKLEKG